jgi:dipeptidyl aminopeptidase/acylaminoacyl peptidase
MMKSDTFIQQLLSLPSILDALLSPDGRWVAFMWYRRHANIDVFLVPTDGSQPPVPLTHTPEYTELVSWTTDSRAVIVAEDHDGDERTRLFKVEITHPQEMVALTEDSPPYFIRGGSLHPNGRFLFYGMNYDVTNGQITEPTWVYQHDLGTGQRIPLAKPAKPAYLSLKMNLQGSHLLFSSKDHHPAGVQYSLLDLGTGAEDEILNFGDRYKVQASWFPNGEDILVLSESRDGNSQEHKSLGIYHWPSSTLRWLVDDPNRTLEDAWVSPEGTIILDEVREAGHKPSWIDPKTGVEQPFPRFPGNLLPLGRSADGEWIGVHYSATSPGELVRFSLEPGAQQAPVSLTHVWSLTDLSPQDLTPAESFHWQSLDGTTIQGWLYRASPNPKRAILYVHGGPTYHTENQLNAQIQYYVSQGFNVLDINYRGSTGFNLSFQNAIKEDGWGGREQEDITSGAQALIEAGLAEPGRMGVTGTSYGGYSAWCQITRNGPEMIAASAPICGMTDLVVDYQTTRPDLRPLSIEMIGGTPEEIPEKYKERSPIHFVDQIRGQLLIVQGGRDPNVTPANVREVETRLKKYNIPYQTLVFDDEGHGIAKPANQARLYPALAAFFNQALGPNSPA